MLVKDTYRKTPGHMPGRFRVESSLRLKGSQTTGGSELPANTKAALMAATQKKERRNSLCGAQTAGAGEGSRTLVLSLEG